MKYIILYVKAVYNSWVALLSGIASIVLTVISPIVTDQTLAAFRVAALICLVAAMFTVWINELFGQERAESVLKDDVSRRKKLVVIATLINGGNSLKAFDGMHMDNVAQCYEARNDWQKKVREFIASEFPEITIIPYEIGIGQCRNWGPETQEIVDNDINLLETLKLSITTPATQP